jgi:hypothetical protein
MVISDMQASHGRTSAYACRVAHIGIQSSDMDPTEQDNSQDQKTHTSLEYVMHKNTDLHANVAEFVATSKEHSMNMPNIHQLIRLGNLTAAGEGTAHDPTDFINGSIIAFQALKLFQGHDFAPQSYVHLNNLYTHARRQARSASNNTSDTDVQQHRLLRRQIVHMFNTTIDSDPAFADIDTDEVDMLYDMYTKSGRNPDGIVDTFRGYRMVRNVAAWQNRQRKIRSIKSLLLAPIVDESRQAFTPADQPSAKRIVEITDQLEQDWELESCDTQIAFLHTRLMYHIDALPHDLNEVSIIDDIQAILAEELVDDMNKLPTLKLGDTLKVVGNTVCLIVKDDSLETVYFVADSSSIRGELAELDVMSIPSQYAVDKGTSDHERSSASTKVSLSMIYSLVIKLDHAKIVKADGFSHEIPPDVDCYVATDYNDVHVYHTPSTGTKG